MGTASAMETACAMGTACAMVTLDPSGCAMVTDEAKLQGVTHPVRVFRARRVHTMADDGPPPGAFVAVGDRVAATGTPAALQERFPEAERVDLGDAVVVPGFHDAHMHPSMTAEDLLHADLSAERVRSPEQLRAALAEQAARVPPGGWVRGSRYDHIKTSGGVPIDRHGLDEATGGRPALVVQVAGHWAVASSAALAAAGIDDHSEPPPGGSYGRDAAGHLNGVVYERAMDRVFAVMPATGLDDRLRGLAAALEMFHAAGLTSVGDTLVDGAGLELFQEAERRGRLSMRVNMLLVHERFEHLRRLGLRTGFGSHRLRLAGVKAFVDGAIAGRTCLLEEPFEGSDDHGMQTTSTEELHALVLDVHRCGSRLGVHANGDRAIALLLDAFEAAERQAPRGDAHHRIEHCTVITPEIVERMRRLGVVAVPFGSYVAYHGAKLVDWYGERRLERMFAHRTLLDAGITVAGSSDYPCGPFEPLLAMRSCVTRESSEDGRVLGGSQRISAREALALYTTGAAAAFGERRFKGRLAPGYLADFTVLGDDPLEVDPRRLDTVPVLQTWVGARRVGPAA
jgi:predicted amidohydrolase YtcJ